MPLIYSQSLTILRAVRLRDSGGSLTPQSDWPNAVEIILDGVSVQPKMTTETRDAAGIQPTEAWMVYGQTGVRLDIQPGDRAVWDGRTFDVVGNPQFWPALLGPGVHHTEVEIRLSPMTHLSATGVTAILAEGVSAVESAQVIFTP